MNSRRTLVTRSAALAVAGATLLAGSLSGSLSGSWAATGAATRAVTAQADLSTPPKVPTSTGYGGAVTSVDPEASKVGLRVLRDGGNAVDAAVATAAALGVTEPYSAGIGGGGYFVYYDAASGAVRTIDGRETAPRKMPRDAFINPQTGEPYRFSPELVTSGVSVGVPGTAATWASALKRWGSTSLGQALKPATRLASRGFVVDDTFREQTRQNRERFRAFPSTRKLFLRDGSAPAVGSVFKNPDLADTYRLLARKGMGAFYRGPVARQISKVVQSPPKTSTTDLPVPPGYLEPRDLSSYSVRAQAPTRVRYRGYDVYGMAPSSSGGSTVGEALNILERFKLSKMTDPAALHRYLEATALAFADRAAYVGDAAFVDVPLRDLLSDEFAKERACRIRATTALDKPVVEGNVDDYDGRCDRRGSGGTKAEDNENLSTTNLTVADKWGNVVEYTLTIEQTGGSGIVVPRRGFLLNNELTDFSVEFVRADPNRIQGGKRPRSSMSPTIILENGKPFLALGSPGGSTIITTVTQMIFNRIDQAMPLPRAIAAPRAAQRNTTTVSAEPRFLRRYRSALESYGHELVVAGDGLTNSTEIGAATAIEFGRNGRLTAVAEPTRRGGGSALVVRPAP